MGEEVPKYRLDPIPRTDLMQIVNQNLKCDDCERIEWTVLPKATRIKPPPKSIAIIVDVIQSQGAIHITRENGAYLDMVGTEFAGHLVIVPWDSTWYLRGSGSIEVGYAIGKGKG